MFNELRNKFQEAIKLEDEAIELCFKVLDLRAKSEFVCERLESLAERLDRRRMRRRDKRSFAYDELKNFYLDRDHATLDQFNAQRVAQ